MSVGGADLILLFGERYPSAFREGCARLIAACGPGWLPIIESLCSLLHERNVRAGEDVGYVHAVKEKFGGIRILLTGSSEERRAWVDFALTHSMRTCEICGGQGRLVVADGWQRTRCEAHRDVPAHLAV